MKKVLVVIVVFTFLGLSVFGYPIVKAFQSPINTLASCSSLDAEKTRIALFGDSLTQGSMSFDYASHLSSNFPTINFINAGKNAQLSFQLTQQIESLVSCGVSEVIVLIGDNDIFYHSFPEYASFYTDKWQMTETQSIQLYEKNIRQIAESLKQRKITTTFVSPALIAGSDRFIDAGQYVETLRKVTTYYGASYIPLYESISTVYRDEPNLNGFCNTGINYYEFLSNNYVSLVNRYILNSEWRDISQKRNMKYTHDCVHLDEDGGEMLLSLLTPHIKNAYITK
jgi:lysophospholipase L1-like esterase